VIKEGDTKLFRIDPKTGVIQTIRGLNYENQNQHVLIVGTKENTSDLPGSTTRVVINVEVFSINKTQSFRYENRRDSSLIIHRHHVTRHMSTLLRN